MSKLGCTMSKLGSKMAKLRSTMAKPGSKMAKLGSKMVKLRSQTWLCCSALIMGTQIANFLRHSRGFRKYIFWVKTISEKVILCVENNANQGHLHFLKWWLSDGWFGGCFLSSWGSDGGPWGHGWERWPPGTWMRPEDAVDGLSGKFWASTTWLWLHEILLGENGCFEGCLPSFLGSDGGPWGHGCGWWPPGTWIRPEDAVDELSGKFLAAMTWLYLGYATPIKRLPLSNFTPKQIELESRGWSQFFANCLLFLKNTKVLNFSLFLHKKIDAFKDNIINAKVSLNTILHNLNEPDSHCFLHLGKPFYTGFCRKKCIF